MSREVPAPGKVVARGDELTDPFAYTAWRYASETSGWWRLLGREIKAAHSEYTAANLDKYFFEVEPQYLKHNEWGEVCP